MASIQKRQTAKRGREGVRWDVVFRDPDGKQKRRTFLRETDAKRFASATEADLSRGSYVDARNPTTVSEYAQTWAASRPHRASTAERVRSTLRCHVDGTALGRRRIVDVRTSEVQRWVNDRAEHLAPSTLRQLVKLVRSVFLDAQQEGVIARSPAVRISVPADDRRLDSSRPIKTDRVVPLTVEQVRALAAAMPARHRAMVLTQAGLGLRAGELLGLRVADIDRERREVCITEQVHPRTRERVPLKTRRSRRVVPLPRLVADALDEHLAAYPPGEDGTVFTGETTGRPYCREVYSRSIARTVRKAGLPAGTTSHDLRHHYASVLLDAGESVATVAERLGDTATMVLEVYGHMMPGTEDRTRRAVDEAWSLTPALRLVTSA